MDTLFFICTQTYKLKVKFLICKKTSELPPTLETGGMQSNNSKLNIIFCTCKARVKYICYMNTESVREHLSRGDTGEALQALVALLEPHKQLRDSLLRIARLNEADYQAVRKKELKNILSYSEAQRAYNRINDNILALLDELDEGGTPAGMAIPPRPGYLPWALGGAAVLFLSAGIWHYTNSNAEAEAWRQACATHNRAAYQAYRTQYPDHRHTLAAADSLAVLDARIQYLGQSAAAFIAAESFEKAALALEKIRRLDPENPELKRLTEQLPK